MRGMVEECAKNNYVRPGRNIEQYNNFNILSKNECQLNIKI